jgi:O-antigen/teichoic acid export membrane protein
MSLAQRSARSIAWQSGSTWIARIVHFGRSILLARLLPIEVFGFYALATSIINLTAVVSDFGTAHAFLHRSEETEDEERAARGFFTLKLFLLSIWILLLLGIGLLFFRSAERSAFFIMVAAKIPFSLAFTSLLLLNRRVKHQRYALIQITDAIVSSGIALWIASNGSGLSALVSLDVTYSILVFLFVFTWNPVWIPRVEWNARIIRYYLRFGSKDFLGEVLLRTLDRIDDLWTSVFLGETALGLYSRAYTFATYPRTLLAVPINSVILGTFTELKAERERLSSAFRTASSILIRTGFLLVGIFVLIAPEFIELLLGSKWLPMLPAFQLMVVYALLDPMIMTMGYLLVARGQPTRILRIRLWQLGVMMLGLFAFGIRYGILGVAAAADLMMIVGMILYLRETKKHVDFSLRQLFVIPSLAFLVGLGVSLLMLENLPEISSLWILGGVKFAAFGLVYTLLVILPEWKSSIQLVRKILALIFRNESSDA